MRKETISFTIDQERLALVDALAVELDRDRSSTLRQVIDAGVPLVKAARQVREAIGRHPLPASAFQNADADQAVA